LQQTTSDVVSIGTDADSPFLERTFWATLPAGASTWSELRVIGNRSVPMIRISCSATSGQSVELRPVSGRDGPVPPRRGAVQRIGYGVRPALRPAPAVEQRIPGRGN
jgi:hypothetical protein